MALDMAAVMLGRCFGAPRALLALRRLNGSYGLMRLPLTGGCQCGAIRYEITRAPGLVYTCHCTECQRLTGSAFSMAVVIAADAFRLAGSQPRSFLRMADSRRTVTRWVGPDCGTWLWSGPKLDPGTRGALRVRGRHAR
jgi:hypothetical protein